MDLFLNFGLAWISVIFAIILSVIYIFRILMKKSDKYKKIFTNLNRILRKHHKYIGALLIITGFVHGFFSSESVLSLNIGTISWVLSILLGFNWMFRKIFSKSKGWLYYHRILTIGFVLTLVLHIFDVGIQAPQLLMDLSAPVPQSEISYDENTLDSINEGFQGVKLKDGTFEGEATGYKPGLKVSVEIKNNKITSITIIEHNEENSRIYTPAMDNVPQYIVDNQSLDVDTVSGCTMSSVGIINATNDALSKALVSGELPELKALPENRKRH